MELLKRVKGIWCRRAALIRVGDCLKFFYFSLISEITVFDIFWLKMSFYQNFHFTKARMYHSKVNNSHIFMI